MVFYLVQVSTKTSEFKWSTSDRLFPWCHCWFEQQWQVISQVTNHLLLIYWEQLVYLLIMPQLIIFDLFRSIKIWWRKGSFKNAWKSPEPIMIICLCWSCLFRCWVPLCILSMEILNAFHGIGIVLLVFKSIKSVLLCLNALDKQ